MNEENEEEYRLTLWGCLVEVLEDYNISTGSLTPRMGEHLVEDFMELLEKQGYIRKREEEEE